MTAGVGVAGVCSADPVIAAAAAADVNDEDDNDELGGSAGTLEWEDVDHDGVPVGRCFLYHSSRPSR